MCLIIFATSLHHFIDTFFLSKYDISSKSVTENLILFCVSMSVIFLGLIFLLCTCNIYIGLPIMGVGVIIYIVDFYLTKHKYNYKYEWHFHPLSIVLMIAVVFFLISIIPAFITQVNALRKGFTIKQEDSVKKKLHELKSTNINIDPQYKPNTNCCKGLCNIIKFIFRKTNDSLVNIKLK